jgi:hypothetical protein
MRHLTVTFLTVIFGIFNYSDSLFHGSSRFADARSPQGKMILTKKNGTHEKNVRFLQALSGKRRRKKKWKAQG